MELRYEEDTREIVESRTLEPLLRFDKQNVPDRATIEAVMDVLRGATPVIRIADSGIENLHERFDDVLRRLERIEAHLYGRPSDG